MKSKEMGMGMGMGMGLHTCMNDEQDPARN